MNYFKIFSLTLLASLTLISCSDDDNDDDVLTDGQLEISIQNLPDPGDAFEYHAWLIGEDGFNRKLGSLGELPDSTYSMAWDIEDLGFLSRAELVLITLESAIEDPLLPSRFEIAEAVFGIDEAHRGLFTSTPMRQSLDDFEDATGLFFLSTPTTAASDDATSGLWFGDYNNGMPIPSLNIPVLNEGWVYQGWVEADGQMYRTGHFNDPTQADEAEPYSGPDSGYGFPGEDFIENIPGLNEPLDLTNRPIMLTVQPDTMPDQFFPMVIFRNTSGVSAEENQILDNEHMPIDGEALRK